MATHYASPEAIKRRNDRNNPVWDAKKRGVRDIALEKGWIVDRSHQTRDTLRAVVGKERYQILEAEYKRRNSGKEETDMAKCRGYVGCTGLDPDGGVCSNCLKYQTEKYNPLRLHAGERDALARKFPQVVFPAANTFYVSKAITLIRDAGLQPPQWLIDRLGTQAPTSSPQIDWASIVPSNVAQYLLEDNQAVEEIVEEDESDEDEMLAPLPRKAGIVSTIARLIKVPRKITAAYAKAQNNRCIYCGRVFGMPIVYGDKLDYVRPTFEHFIAQSSFGDDVAAKNANHGHPLNGAACTKCNMAKGDGYFTTQQEVRQHDQILKVQRRWRLVTDPEEYARLVQLDTNKRSPAGFELDVRVRVRENQWA